MNGTVPLSYLFIFLACAPSCSLQAQTNDEPKAKISISITEDGETKQVEREIPLNDPDALENALRELGIMQEFNIDGGANRIEINIRKHGDDGVLKDMDLSLFMDEPGTAVWVAGEPRAYLGVYSGNWCQSTCEDDKKKNKNNSSVKDGACITHVIEGTAAEKAGLKEGDVIVAIDDYEVKSHGHLSESMAVHKPGDTVKVTYWRDGKKNTVTANLGETEGEEVYKYGYNFDGGGAANAYVFDMGGAFLGVVPGETVNGGLTVEDVVDGSSAEAMGLQDGDIIKSLNDRSIANFDDLVAAVEVTEPDQEVLLSIDRGGKPMDLKGKMGRHEAFTFEMPEAPEMPEMPELAPLMDLRYMQGLSPEAREDLQQEMDQLREEMAELREELRGNVHREMRVTIERKELTQEETAVLRNKGVAGLDNKLDLTDLRCFPNPSDGYFRLQFNVPAKGDLNVDVHDAKGERVYHESISDYEGQYERTLNLSSKADGGYYLVITQNGRTFTQKLVKE